MNILKECVRAMVKEEKEASRTTVKATPEVVIKFFKDNPNPTDTTLHAWAERQGYDVHAVESLVYTLATKYVQSLDTQKE